jgi:hypothetical protein
MPEPLRPAPEGFIARRDQPLIGFPEQQNGQEVTRYFTDEADADQALDQAGGQQALNMLGAWRHLDTPDVFDELDRIRHAGRPTPPIELPELDDEQTLDAQPIATA